MDETTPRATITQVYELIGELRKEFSQQLSALDKKQEVRFEQLLIRLETAVNGIRGEFVPEALCVERHDAQDAALIAAVKVSEEDREKLWGSIHELERAIKWAAAGIIGGFGSVSLYLIIQHFS